MTNALMEQDILRMKDDIGSIFDNVLGGRCACSAEDNSLWAPATDVVETKDAFKVKVALPGVKKEDVETEIKEDLLTISGKRALCDCKDDDSTACLRQEIPSGNFYRAFKIGARIKTAEAKATFSDGILTVNIPKAEEEKTNKITIE